jgi:hypothetical protein
MSLSTEAVRSKGAVESRPSGPWPRRPAGVIALPPSRRAAWPAPAASDEPSPSTREPGGRLSVDLPRRLAGRGLRPRPSRRKAARECRDRRLLAPRGWPRRAVRHSASSRCWKQRRDRLDPRRVPRSRCASVFGQSEEATLGGAPAYRAGARGLRPAVPSQTERHRLEVVGPRSSRTPDVPRSGSHRWRRSSVASGLARSADRLCAEGSRGPIWHCGPGSVISVGSSRPVAGRVVGRPAVAGPGRRPILMECPGGGRAVL